MSKSRLLASPLFQAGTICCANCSYQADEEEELSFTAGDYVTLLEAKGKGCFQASLTDGTIGIVHERRLLQRKEIALLPMPWYHGRVSRFEAEKMLDAHCPGQFIVRTTKQGTQVYSLSISCEGGIVHYLIATVHKRRQVTLDGKHYFRNLCELIEHYRENQGVLRHRPVDPLGRRGVLDFHVDLSMMKHEWGIKRKEVEYGEKIGFGEFGDVYSGEYRDVLVAVKSLKIEQENSIAGNELAREAAILTNLRHKNIVQLVGLLFVGISLQGIVMEMMSKGSLLKYLSTRGRAVLSLKQLLSFSLNVCDGMCYLSQKGFVHRDLAARNILLNQNGEAKISDLGLARKVEIFVPHEGGKFPIKWTAPEALKYSKFSVKSDVWSFGIFLWEVFSYGRVPYPSVSVDEVVRFLEDGNVMEPPEDCPPAVETIMLSCWHIEPEQRPLFEDLKCMLESFRADSSEDVQSPALTSRTGKSKAIPSSYPIESLARSSEAMLLYNNVLRTNKMVTLYNTNLLLLGPEGSGKTSLLHNFQGQPFRSVEPPSSSITIGRNPLELSHKSWEASNKGFSVEESRLRSVVEDLVGSLKKMSSSSLVTGPDAHLTPPPLPLRECPRKSSTTDDIDSRSDVESPDSANLLFRRNTFSGNGLKLNRPHSASAFPVMELSVNITPGDGNGDGSIDGSLSEMSDSPSTFKRIWGSFKRHTPSKKQTGEIKPKSLSSDVTPATIPIVTTETAISVNGNGNIPTSNNVSPIPDSDSDTASQNWARNPPSAGMSEDAIQGIIYGLEQCKKSSTLPPVCFARTIDFPGSTAHSLVRPLFFTKRSLALVSFNLSRNLSSTESLTRYGSSMSLVSTQTNGSQLYEVGYSPHVYLDCILSEMMDLYLHIPSKNLEEQLANNKILLVGTHVEKCNSFMHRSKQLKAVKEAAMDLACRPMLSTQQQFAVSSSSILDRSNVDELQKAIAAHIKKHMRQTVPIRWLEAACEVQSSLNGPHEFIIPKTKFCESISRFCISSEEVENLIEFLHDHLFILHPSHVHSLKDVVVTDPMWFSHNISRVFSLTHPTNTSRLKSFRKDITQLKSTGSLSNTLLNEVWKGISPWDQTNLLVVMHKMDMLVCMNPFQEVMSFHSQRHSMISFDQLEIADVIVPVLVQKQPPDFMFANPSCNIEPLYFRFKGGFLPADLFPRLLARCIRAYTANYSLYKGLATFEIDNCVTVFLQEMEDSIRLWVQVEDFMNQAPPSPNESVISLNFPPSKTQPSSESCMSLLMFLKASLSDIIHQWIPQLDFDLCVECFCAGQKGGRTHYAVLNDTEIWMGQQLIECEEGTEITPLVGVTRWFGSSEDDVVDMAVATDELELMADDDIQLVSQALGKSWRDLGEILGFSDPELNIIEATSVASSSGKSPLLKRAEKRLSEPGLSRRLSTSSRMLRKLRQSVFSTSDLLSNDLPPGERMLIQWQHDTGNEATLSCLISALEIIQRQDIADELIESRIDGPGFVI